MLLQVGVGRRAALGARCLFGGLRSVSRYSTKATTPADEVFDKLLKNVISRHDQDKASVYKSFLDMHDDHHFKFESHQADLTFARVGDKDKPLMELDPHGLALLLLSRKFRRGYLYFDRNQQRLVPSDPILQPLADHFTKDAVDFDEHEAIFIEVGRRSKSLMSAHVWRTDRGQAVGGVRLERYSTTADFLRDGLRLSLCMGRKAAAGDIWTGGGAGIIARPPGNAAQDEGFRKLLFQDYGEFVTSLRGCFVAGEDTGLSVRDLDWMHSRSRFIACISPSIGGTGKPVGLTAAGIISAMESGLAATGLGTLEGKTVALQGIGSIGDHMLRHLLQRNVARIIAVDTNGPLVERMKRTFEGEPVDLRVIKENDMSILEAECDILSPNAIGGILNERTIPNIKAKFICGGANCQLAVETEDARRLADRGIELVPDYIASRMGLVAASWEPFGLLDDDDPLVQQHFNQAWAASIPAVTKKVFAEARATGETTTQVAARIADSRSRQPHPLIGSRTESIIAALVASKWHLQGNSK